MSGSDTALVDVTRPAPEFLRPWYCRLAQPSTTPTAFSMNSTWPPARTPGWWVMNSSSFWSCVVSATVPHGELSDQLSIQAQPKLPLTSAPDWMSDSVMSQ